MFLDAASRALTDIFSPAVRAVFWKVMGLTIFALIALWALFQEVFVQFVMPWIGSFLPDLPSWAGWLALVAMILSALGFALLVAMLLAPISAIVAGFFLDDAAEAIERRDYGLDAPGSALPLYASLVSSTRFLAIVILANMLALLFLLVPGVNLLVFFLVNGYLLGREYFEFAAARHIGIQAAREFRRQNAGQVMAGGLLVALFMFVPLLNLITPLFAAVMMVHLFKGLDKARPRLR